MRVLGLLWGFSLGGIGKYAVTLNSLNEFPELTFETACICGDNWDCDLSTLKGINAELIRIRSRLDFSWLEGCCKLIRTWQPNLIFVHGFNGPVVAMLLRRKMKREFPFVCSFHGLYHSPKISRICLAPVFSRLAEHIYKYNALGILTVCEYCKKYLLQKGVPPNKVVTIHNGMPENTSEGEKLKRSAIGLLDNDFVIGAVSRLNPVKGLEYLIDAVANLRKTIPQTKLVLVGTGTCMKKLKLQCEKLNIEQALLFAGYQNNIDSWMGLFDVFALPSLAESHSIALLEAMRAGLPIVATNVGGNPESLRDGKEGTLVPARDSKALEIAIRELISKPDMRMRLGEAAKRRFEEKFTTEKMLKHTASWLLSFKEKIEFKS